MWRIIKLTLLVILLFVLLVYGCLWFASRKIYPVEFGLSFNKNYSQSLGLDWQKNYLDMLDQLKPKYLRLAAPWSEVESIPGNFKTENLDWQLAEALKRGVKITLEIGQKAPRWPECYVPDWANKLSDKDYQQELLVYLKFMVDKYKDYPALEIWQVENEPFISFSFGNCPKFDEGVVKNEVALVKSLDPRHQIMVTDSGELSTWQKSIKAADLFGTTIYRIVRTPGGWRWGYDWLPAAYYRIKAELWGRDLSTMYVAELQAEPWFNNNNPVDTSISEQEQTMNPDRLKGHLDFVERIGVPRAYLWGVEWWYWMKEAKGDNRYWEIIKQQLAG